MNDSQPEYEIQSAKERQNKPTFNANARGRTPGVIEERERERERERKPIRAGVSKRGPHSGLEQPRIGR